MSDRDLLLTAILVIAVPAYQLWRSLTRAARPAEPRIVRYRRSLTMIGTLLLALVALWWTSDRSVALLGLGWPPPTAGWIGLALAAVLIVGMSLAARRARPPADGPAAESARAMMPQTMAERRWYLAFAVGAGVGWELLYRGYLWWALAPAIGSVGAVVVMASSYAVAHGYNGVRPMLGALLSALLFATGYALTQSLWWLIAIHTAFPLFALLLRPPSDALEK